MIAPWPPKSRYKSAKRLRKAIDTTAHTDALADFMASTYAIARAAAERLEAMQAAVTKALADIDALRSNQDVDITNSHLTNIRDDLAAVLDESDRV